MPASYFETLYADNADPWNFASSDYEKKKYAASMAALPRIRFQRALEVGCSIGVFTRLLATKCNRLLAVDPVEQALSAARIRCSGLPNIDLEKMTVPSDWPAGQFDLIVLSEVVYYLSRPEIHTLAKRIKASMLPGGCLLLVHWLGETNYPISGDDAAEALISGTRSFLKTDIQTRTDHYRLDLLLRG